MQNSAEEMQLSRSLSTGSYQFTTSLSFSPNPYSCFDGGGTGDDGDDDVCCAQAYKSDGQQTVGAYSHQN